ncbi:MAG TPA: LuxR C-terminal-related transcriptional regulator [Roseiflexaceae bacterium]|nr:LuxR C-terminal-related transcriptional regulator [Roseiflexaceae bacterium]
MQQITSMALVPKAGARVWDADRALLATKLYIPSPRPTLVLRDCLIAKLNNSLRRGCQLILVSAPAGAGKTTLLSSWLGQLSSLRDAGSDAAAQRRRLGLAWLTLDRDDNQPTRFWAYAIGAFQTIDPSLGLEAQRLLVAPQRPSIRTILSSLLNDLAAYSDPIVLVLDDFELITASAIHKGIVFIADHAPAQLHIVLSSRADPPLPLARLRAHDQLAEVHGKELAFTVDEMAAFLAAATNIGWRDEDVAALHDRTEGWIAGLQIAGRELQQLLADSPAARTGREIARFIDNFSGHHQDIRDFLETEVLKLQPQRIQTFLVLTSILERMNGSLCDAVAEQTGGQELLEQLVKANLFVLPCDGDGGAPWYRYQRMFAQVLQARLSQTRPGLAPLLHRRAAEWYAEHGDLAAASRHQWQANRLAWQLNAQDSAAAPPNAANQPALALPAALGPDKQEDGALIVVNGVAADYPANGQATMPDRAPLLQQRVPREQASEAEPNLAQATEGLQLAEQLTERELEILQLMVEGLSYMEIADRLVIGLNTVRFHVKNMYGKLDVHQRAQAIARAKQLRVLLP